MVAMLSAPASKQPAARSSVMPPIATSGRSPISRFHSAMRDRPCGAHGIGFTVVA